jgi:hypothetical protein
MSTESYGISTKQAHGRGRVTIDPTCSHSSHGPEELGYVSITTQLIFHTAFFLARRPFSSKWICKM